MPIDARAHAFDTAIVNGKEALFVKRRIGRSRVPDGSYLYHVGYHNSARTYASVSHHLRSRFAGFCCAKNRWD